MKNKKPIIFIALLIVACFVVGGTLAYYTSSSVFTNTFNTSPYQVLTQEEFASPDNWTPGDTTTKTIFATNKGNSPVAVRVKLTENWVDENGNPLPLVDSNDDPLAIINFSSGYENDWAYLDGYYYFTRALSRKQSTTPLIDSVTYNPAVRQEATNTCVLIPETHKKKCTMAVSEYGGGKYTLQIDIETCQYNQYQNIWGVEIPVSDPIVIDGVLIAQSSDATTTFGKDISRDSFESIMTVDTSDVPNDVIGSWDASTDQNRMVMAWYKDEDNDGKYELYLGQDGGVKANPNSSYAFSKFNNVATIDLTHFDTSNATNMEFMFYNAGQSVNTFTTDVSNFNTSNVTNIRHMFRACGYNSTSWSIGDLSEWDTSKVTMMNSLFMDAGYKSSTWSVGDLSNWETSNVENMAAVFEGAGYSASTLDISYIEHWDVSNVTNLNLLFRDTGYNATTINFGDLSGWNTSKVELMDSTFYNVAANVTNLDLSFIASWDTSSVTDMSYMFFQAGYSATTLNLGNLTWNTSNVEDMEYMFYDAFPYVTSINLSFLSGWNVSSVKKFNCMFYYSFMSLETFNLDLSSWDVSSGQYFGSMFYDTADYATVFNLNLTGWNPSSAVNMYNMFYAAGFSAETFSLGNLSSWDTRNVTNMQGMFYYAGYNATTWNSFGSLKVYATNVQEMFRGVPLANGTLNIYTRPTSYSYMFNNAATSGSGIVVNYTSSVTNIDNLVATKSSNSNVTKGSIIS